MKYVLIIIKAGMEIPDRKFIHIRNEECKNIHRKSWWWRFIST
jgi:hypothetical protein